MLTSGVCYVPVLLLEEGEFLKINKSPPSSGKAFFKKIFSSH
jgi:hypothetical protein